jgi:magnesium transporter
MISLYRWDPERKQGGWLDPQVLNEAGPQFVQGPGFLWIDLDDPTEDEERLIFQKLLPVHPLTLEDMTRLRKDPSSLPHFPKVEEFDDYLFIVINPSPPAPHGPHGHGKTTVVGRESSQLNMVLTATILVTHHYDSFRSIDEVRKFVERHQSLAGRGTDYICHLILDVLVDQYAPLLDHFDARLDALEEAVIRQPGASVLQTILQLKHHFSHLRKTMHHERELLARLVRGDFDLISDREIAYYRNVYDHLIRFSERVENSRDLLSDLLQIHHAAEANKLNEIMKVLTMISTVVLPMTLIAGIYGMNFENIPELHLSWGYPLALGLMLLTGVSSFSFFRWKKWI